MRLQELKIVHLQKPNIKAIFRPGNHGKDGLQRLRLHSRHSAVVEFTLNRSKMRKIDRIHTYKREEQIIHVLSIMIGYGELTNYICLMQKVRKCKHNRVQEAPNSYPITGVTHTNRISTNTRV